MMKCEKCGNLQYEWESALSGLMACSNCSEPLNAPRPEKNPTRKLAVSRKDKPERVETRSTPAEEAQPMAGHWDTVLAGKLRNMVDNGVSVPLRFTVTPYLISWAILIAIGIPLLWFRYGVGLGSVNESMIQYFGIRFGPILLLIAHISIVLLAFQDDFSCGLLCLLVPLYSFYYILAQPEYNLLRIFLCLMMLFIGVEIYEGTSLYLGEYGREIHAWIGRHEHEGGFE